MMFPFLSRTVSVVVKARWWRRKLNWPNVSTLMEQESRTPWKEPSLCGWRNQKVVSVTNVDSTDLGRKPIDHQEIMVISWFWPRSMYHFWHEYNFSTSHRGHGPHFFLPYALSLSLSNYCWIKFKYLTHHMDTHLETFYHTRNLFEINHSMSVEMIPKVIFRVKQHEEGLNLKENSLITMSCRWEYWPWILWTIRMCSGSSSLFVESNNVHILW